MKKESVNTFNEGLNYDLNPITTPNNVLTDNINGTFITFNGDELALQNEAGNTTIKFNNTYVKLTEDFYPLDITEKGGVLYITSAKSRIYSSLPWNKDTNYNIGDIVRVENLYYYAILDNNNEFPIEPINLNEQSGYDILEKNDEALQLGYKWLWLGSKEYIKQNVKLLDPIYLNQEYTEEIEFGSYPSPQEASDYNKYTASDYSLIVKNGQSQTTKDYIKKYLSTPQIINLQDFKAGEYIIFKKNEGSVIDTSNVSYINSDGTMEKKTYKVRLLQQLTNGFIDLTDNVWNIYKQFKVGYIPGTHFWFNDDTFKYTCPSNYKGKLAISVEPEEIDRLSLTQTTITFDNTDLVTPYLITSYLKFINNSGLVIEQLRINYSLDDVEQTPKVISVNNIDENYQFIIKLPLSERNKTLSYQVTPIFKDFTESVPQVEFNSYLDDCYLPDSYLSKYIFNGNILISTNFDNVVLSKEGLYSCYYDSETNIGWQTSTCLALKDLNNNYLDNGLSISNTGNYAFILEGKTVPGYNILGHYTIDPLTNKVGNITYNQTYPLNGQSFIEALLKNTVIKIESKLCAYKQITFIFNRPLTNVDGNITIDQTINGQIITKTIIPTITPTKEFNVNLFVGAECTWTQQYSSEDSWLFTPTPTSTTYNVAYVDSDAYTEETDITESGDVQTIVTWSNWFYKSLGINNVNAILYSPVNLLSTPTVYTTSIVLTYGTGIEYKYTSEWHLPNSLRYSRLDFPTLTGTYDNISDNSNYTKYVSGQNSIIIRKS